VIVCKRETEREREREVMGILKVMGLGPITNEVHNQIRNGFTIHRQRRQTDKKIDIKDKQAGRLRNGICLTRIVFEI
jgi:hypothetical protein